MSREILFRGKVTGENKWFEGYYVKQFGANIIYLLESDEYGFEYRHVDPATVGQYTGVEDQSGKKIFEGDVIQTTKYGVDNGRGQNYSGKDKFIVGYSDGTYTLENGRRRFCLRPDTDAIVCGNIYDNPELLEEAQHDD